MMFGLGLSLVSLRGTGGLLVVPVVGGLSITNSPARAITVALLGGSIVVTGA